MHSFHKHLRGTSCMPVKVLAPQGAPPSEDSRHISGEARNSGYTGNHEGVEKGPPASLRELGMLPGGGDV